MKQSTLLTPINNSLIAGCITKQLMVSSLYYQRPSKSKDYQPKIFIIINFHSQKTYYSLLGVQYKLALSNTAAKIALHTCKIKHKTAKAHSCPISLQNRQLLIDMRKFIRLQFRCLRFCCLEHRIERCISCSKIITIT